MSLTLVDKPVAQRASQVFTDEFMGQLTALNKASRRLRELGFAIDGETIREGRGGPLIRLKVHPGDWTSQRLLRRFVGVRCAVTEGGKCIEHGTLDGVDVRWTASPDLLAIDERVASAQQ